MSAINEKARNKMLIIKGVLAERCGLTTELYNELSRELDEFMMVVATPDKFKLSEALICPECKSNEVFYWPKYKCLECFDCEKQWQTEL